jgi:Fe-S cluster assembly iron-binding protein IscA
MGMFSFMKKNKESQEELKSSFNVVISPTVLDDVKSLLNKQNKTAVRFVVSGMCWSGSKLAVVLDEQKENDLVVEQDGIKFVINSNYKNLVGTLEVTKENNQITAKNVG